MLCTPVNEEAGEGQMEKYPWGEDECEADGQPGCQTILEEEMLPLSVDGKAFGFYDVRSCPLPQLKAGKRKSNGYPEPALGPEKSMKYALTHAKDLVLAYTDALVELKVARRDLKPGQLLLQLVSLSLISGRGQGVVMLGTDCVDKWRMLYFSGHNTIVVQPYLHGKQCIADFKSLMVESAARKDRNVAPMNPDPIVEGSEADIDLEDFGVEETERDKAIAQETKLRKLAGALTSLYCEELEVPYWAKASETSPSYYILPLYCV